MFSSTHETTPPLLENTFPLTEVFCNHAYVEFLIIGASITAGIIINQLVIFRLFSDEWYILQHVDDTSKLPVALKFKLIQNYQTEGIRVAEILLTYLPNQDVVDVICYFLDNTNNPNSPRSRARSRSRSPSPPPPAGRCTSTSLTMYDSEIEMFPVTEEQMTRFVDQYDSNSDDNEGEAIWKNREYLNRYLSCYVNRVVLWSAMYSLIVVGAQMVTLILVIYEFVHWTIVDDSESLWDYYNGLCICLALLHPFLKYYKLHPFYTSDFGSYNPHFIPYQHIVAIADNEWHKLSILHYVTTLQLWLSITLGVLWMPLLPGALLFLLMIFCFITALGVPFFICYSAFTYLHECYFHRIKLCHKLFKGMHHIVVHLFLLIALVSVHFCHYKSVLTTSDHVYNGKDVLGCHSRSDFGWNWSVHEWHWRNLWIVLTWILL